MRPVRTPSDPRGDLRLARGFPAEALDRASASLEGSEPALEKADRLRPKELSSRTLGVRLYLTGPTVPDPLPARGRVRCRHVSQRWKCSAPVAEDPDPRRWVQDLHVPIRTPRELSAQLAAREGSGASTCHAGAGTSLPLGAPSPTRIKYEWLRHALLTSGKATPRQKGQTALPLTRPPYEGIKCQPLLHSARV